MHGSHALLYGGHDPAMCGYGQGGMALWMLGHPERAVESARQGITVADAVGHWPSVAHSLWFAGAIDMMRRDVPAVLDRGERLLALGGEHRLEQYRALGEMIRG